jgi:hypothetical protein
LLFGVGHRFGLHIFSKPPHNQHRINRCAQCKMISNKSRRTLLFIVALFVAYTALTALVTDALLDNDAGADSIDNERSLRVRKKIDGIGMSGTAFLLPYHLGVAGTFLEYGMFKMFRTAGASGGALSGSIGCSGMPYQELKDMIFASIDECAHSATKCIGNLGEKLAEVVKKVLPKGDEFANCRNRLFTQVTIEVAPNDPSSAVCACTQTENNRGKLIGWYKSRDDFISTLKTTIYLAKIAGPTCTRPYRKFNETCDGGYSDNLPCPPGTLEKGKFCLKVSVYPSFMWSSKTNTTGPADIYPGVRGEATLPIQSHAVWTNLAHDPTTVSLYKDAIYNAGRMDAKYWLDNHGYHPVMN